MNEDQPSLTAGGPSIIVFDCDPYGHHFEFLDHFVEYAGRHPGIQLTVVSHELYEPVRLTANVTIRKLAADAVRAVTSLPIERRSIAEMRLLFGALDPNNRGTLVLLGGDHLMLGVIWYQNRLRTFESVTALQMAPYPQQDRYSPTDATSHRLKSIVRRQRKRWMLRFIFALPKFRLGILNDPDSVREVRRSRMFAGETVFVPDPVIPYVRGGHGIGTERSTDRSSRHLLIAGTINERKSVSLILGWLARLNSEGSMGETLVLHILGRCTDDELSTRLLELKSDQPDAIVVKLDFVEHRELLETIEKVDIVLALYQNFYSSSGILGHAAEAGTPVLGYANTLIGDLITTYNLGAVVDHSVGYDSFKTAVRRVLQTKASIHSRRADYVTERRPSNFVESLCGL